MIPVEAKKSLRQINSDPLSLLIVCIFVSNCRLIRAINFCRVAGASVFDSRRYIQVARE